MIRRFYRKTYWFTSRKFILILGCQRSGTTLLYMMLTSHSSITGRNEDEAFYRFPPVRVLAMNMFRSKYTCYKLPTKAGALPHIVKIFPNAKILWIIRHPYAVVSSMRSLVMNERGDNWLKISARDELKRLSRLFPEINNLNIHEKDEITLGALVWKYKILAMELFKREKLNLSIIKYEDLLENPKATLLPVMNKIGLSWSDELLVHNLHHADKKYCGNNFGSLPIDKSRKSPHLYLNEEEKKIIDQVCQGQMKTYAYNINIPRDN